MLSNAATLTETVLLLQAICPTHVCTVLGRTKHSTWTEMNFFTLVRGRADHVQGKSVSLSLTWTQILVMVAVTDLRTPKHIFFSA
jgi:hypothetical protein